MRAHAARAGGAGVGVRRAEGRSTALSRAPGGESSRRLRRFYTFAREASRPPVGARARRGRAAGRGRAARAGRGRRSLRAHAGPGGDPSRCRSGRPRRARRAGAVGGAGGAAATGDQRDGRRRPYEPGPGAACRGGAPAHRRRRRRLLEPRVRPAVRIPRIAPGPRGADPPPADRCGGGARREQQRGRRAARARRARGKP